MTIRPIVPDLLAPGLDVVFCGTAPSRASAAALAYYAHPGNRFWSTLFEIGLTPKLFAPTDYPKLLSLKIGLTDVCKTHSGNDDELPAHGIDVNAFKTKIVKYQPKFVAFTSLAAARHVLGAKATYGLQTATIGDTRLYACCSTSGRARRFWRPDVWTELRELVRRAA